MCLKDAVLNDSLAERGGWGSAHLDAEAVHALEKRTMHCLHSLAEASHTFLPGSDTEQWVPQAACISGVLGAKNGPMLHAQNNENASESVVCGWQGQV